MELKYRYLFPFESIPKGSKIVIYGLGIVGREYYKQIKLTNYCDIICFIDKRWKELQKESFKVYDQSVLSNLEFDYIVLAFRSTYTTICILDEIKPYGVMEEKIVKMKERTYEDDGQDLYNNHIDYIKEGIMHNKMVVAMHFPATLGDSIIYKKFYEALADIALRLKFDIYSAMNERNLEGIFVNEERINKLIYDPDGRLYNYNISNYSLAISVSEIPVVDSVLYQELEKYDEKLSLKIKELENWYQDYGLTKEMKASLRDYIHRQRQVYKGRNCIEANSCDGVFEINKDPARIFIDDKYTSFKDEKVNGDYITINYGNGVSVEQATLNAKQWPYEYFNKLVRLLHARYKYIKIIQTGAAGVRKIEDCDYYFIGKDLEFTKQLLKKSLLHIDSESGLVHLAKALGRKSIVMVGPSQKYFLYDDNINMLAGVCHGCTGLYEYVGVCARGQKKPECMWSILPEMVMERIEEYMEQIR